MLDTPLSEMTARDRIDWQGYQRVAYAALRLKPMEFWRMTPTELQAMAAARFPPNEISAPTREEMETLYARFPDEG